MQVIGVIPKPIITEAIQYSGTFDSGVAVRIWVSRNVGGRYRVDFDDNEINLVLSGPEGTNDILEGFWIVRDDHELRVYTDDQFNEKYQKLEWRHKNGTW